MDLLTIHRANLQQLLTEVGGKAARLAELTGVPSAYISQLKNATPHAQTGKVRGFGRETLRKLEDGMGKPRGWMSIDHTTPASPRELNALEGQLIGLFRVLNDADQNSLIEELTQRLKRTGPQSPEQPGSGLSH